MNSKPYHVFKDKETGRLSMASWKHAIVSIMYRDPAKVFLRFIHEDTWHEAVREFEKIKLVEKEYD